MDLPKARLGAIWVDGVEFRVLAGIILGGAEETTTPCKGLITVKPDLVISLLALTYLAI